MTGGVPAQPIRQWTEWPSTTDDWIQFVKDAYAVSLINETVFNRSINRILRDPTSARRVMTDMPMPWDIARATL